MDGTVVAEKKRKLIGEQNENPKTKVFRRSADRVINLHASEEGRTSLNKTYLHMLLNNVTNRYLNKIYVAQKWYKLYETKKIRDILEWDGFVFIQEGLLKYSKKYCLKTTLKEAKFDGKEYRTTKGLLKMKNKNISIYHLSLYAARGVPDPGKVASHLCHNANCFNPNHLVCESQILNWQRNHCKQMAEAIRLARVKKQYSCHHDPVCRDCRPMKHAKRIRRQLE